MRLLFTVVFSWFVFSGGRFTAPFLKRVARFDDSIIGIAFAMQVLFGSLFAPYGCVIADKMELKYPRCGRMSCLMLGIIMATIVFELHWVVRLLFGNEKCDCRRMETFLHLLLRILYAICTSMLGPVLDGATLSYLKEKNISKSEYGKERLFGTCHARE